MLHLRGVKLQLGLKPLRRNLTHSVYIEDIKDIRISRISAGCRFARLQPSLTSLASQQQLLPPRSGIRLVDKRLGWVLSATPYIAPFGMTTKG